MMAERGEWIDGFTTIIHDAHTHTYIAWGHQSVEKGKMTAEAAAAEAKAVQGRITYSLDLKDLKEADLVIEVRWLCVCFTAYV